MRNNNVSIKTVNELKILKRYYTRYKISGPMKAIDFIFIFLNNQNNICCTKDGLKYRLTLHQIICQLNRLDELILLPNEWKMVAAALYLPQLPNGITKADMLSSAEYWNACGNKKKMPVEA